MILAAADPKSAQAAAVLEQLCRIYWFPIYAYIRRQGHSPADSQDLAQDFFAGLLTKGSPRGVAPEQGKFRSFLLASLQNFLVDQHRHVSALKRGEGQITISLDRIQAEERFCLEPHHDLTPEQLYERAWARTLLDRARSRLREDYAAAGKAHLYFALKIFPWPARASAHSSRPPPNGR